MRNIAISFRISDREGEQLDALVLLEGSSRAHIFRKALQRIYPTMLESLYISGFLPEADKPALEAQRAKLK